MGHQRKNTTLCGVFSLAGFRQETEPAGFEFCQIRSICTEYSEMMEYETK